MGKVASSIIFAMVMIFCFSLETGAQEYHCAGGGYSAFELHGEHCDVFNTETCKTSCHNATPKGFKVISHVCAYEYTFPGRFCICTINRPCP